MEEFGCELEISNERLGIGGRKKSKSEKNKE